MLGRTFDVHRLAVRLESDLRTRRMHLVRLRTSAKGRIFGLQTQWGLRISRFQGCRRLFHSLAAA